MSADPLTLARAVLARGHTETEAHQLAQALLVANARVDYWRAARNYEHSVEDYWRRRADAERLPGVPMPHDDRERMAEAARAAEARLRALGGRP